MWTPDKVVHATKIFSCAFCDVEVLLGMLQKKVVTQSSVTAIILELQRKLVIQTNEQQLKTEKLSITANAFKQDKLCTAGLKKKLPRFYYNNYLHM